MKEDTVEPLTSADLQWLRTATARAQELLDLIGPIHVFAGVEADLPLAQEVLEDFVYPEDTFELQALGVVLGNVLVAQTELQWSVVTNEFGRQLALYDSQRKITLYPVTMIQKRIEDRREVEMPQLYRALLGDFGLTALQK
jgi:hypothetical protein